MADARVEWAVRAEPTGADLLTGETTVETVDGVRRWRPTFALPAAIAAGAAWILRHRGIDEAGNVEAWQELLLALAAEAVTRATMVYGVDKPIPGVLTGVPEGTVLTDTESTTTPLYVTRPTTYRRVRFRRRVVVQSRWVRFEECEFAGGPTAHTSDHGLLQCFDASLVGATPEEDVQVIDCTFRPQAPGDRVNGFLGWHARFERCDTSLVVDAYGVHGHTWWNANGRPDHYPSGFSAKGCTWHDFYFVPTTTQPDGYPHNDGVQAQGGTYGEILGCWGIARRDPSLSFQGDVVGTGGNASYIGGRTLSNVLFSANVGIPDGWTVDRSWFDAGHLSVQLDPKVNTCRVTGHRFDGTSSGRDINSDAAPKAGVLVHSNTRPDGATANVRRGSSTAQDQAPAPAAGAYSSAAFAPTDFDT